MASSATDFVYPIQQVRDNTGPLTWWLTPLPVGTQLPGVSINQYGVITVTVGQQVQNNIMVSASNLLGHTTSNTFYMQKLRRTAITHISDPTPLSLRTTNWTYPFANTPALDATNGTAGTIRWGITSAPGLVISQAGVITFRTNNYINRNVTVTANNDIGVEARRTFRLHIGQLPVIQSPSGGLFATNPAGTNYTRQFSQTQSEAQTGPLTWSLIANTNTGLSIDSVTGLLTLKNTHTQTTDIRVAATNTIGDTVSITVPMYVVHEFDFGVVTRINQKSVVNQPTIIRQLSNRYIDQSAAVGALSWSIAATSSHVRVHSSTGEITVNANQFMNEVVTISVTNTATTPVTRSISFQLNVGQDPVIDNPGVIYFTGNDVRSFTYQLYSIVPTSRTGPLTWEVTELDGLSVSQSTGLLTYNTENLIGQEKLMVSSDYWTLGLKTFSFKSIVTARREGPTFIDFRNDATYKSQPWFDTDFSLRLNQRGYQQIWIRTPGFYSISAVGAGGGNNPSYTGVGNTLLPRVGGKGAKIEGTVYINANSYLVIVVGQKGTDSSGGPNPGGGGASFVALASVPNASFVALKVLLIGGGGGATGGRGTNNNITASNGEGSSVISPPNAVSVLPSTTVSNGAAGWGYDNTQSSGFIGTCTGGQGLNTGLDGGFGGAGPGNDRAGGCGGGYIGGNGVFGSGAGLSGTSYIDSSVVPGPFTAATNLGDGLVRISYIRT